MVIGHSKPNRISGSLMIELLVAMAIITGVLLPMAYSLRSEHMLARASYQRAIAIKVGVCRGA